MINFTYYNNFLYFSKVFFSSVLLFWAIQNVFYLSGIEKLGLLFTPLRQNPLVWALGFSALEIAIATGLWLPKWESPALAAIGLLLLVQLAVGIINLRVVQASSCPAPGFLEGNPRMVLIQRTALLLIIVTSFLTRRNWKVYSDGGMRPQSHFEMR